MEERTFTIELSNGGRLTHAKQNGTSYIVDETLEESFFDGGLNTVTLTDEDTGAVSVLVNQTLAYLQHESDGTHIGFRNKTQVEVLEERHQAQIDYIAMMADIDL